MEQALGLTLILRDDELQKGELLLIELGTMVEPYDEMGDSGQH